MYICNGVNCSKNTSSLCNLHCLFLSCSHIKNEGKIDYMEKGRYGEVELLRVMLEGSTYERNGSGKYFIYGLKLRRNSWGRGDRHGR